MEKTVELPEKKEKEKIRNKGKQWISSQERTRIRGGNKKRTKKLKYFFNNFGFTFVLLGKEIQKKWN